MQHSCDSVHWTDRSTAAIYCRATVLLVGPCNQIGWPAPTRAHQDDGNSAIYRRCARVSTTHPCPFMRSFSCAAILCPGCICMHAIRVQLLVEVQCIHGQCNSTDVFLCVCVSVCARKERRRRDLLVKVSRRTASFRHVWM